MTFEEIKTAILNLDCEVVPQIWQKASTDESCLVKMR